MANPTKIDIAVEPLRAAARELAAAQAAEIIEQVRAELKGADGDLQKIAPYPSGRGMMQVEYMIAVRNYHLYRNVTSPLTFGARRPADPEPAKMDSNKIRKFIEQAKRDAEDQFIQYARKLNSKIGPVESAVLTSGNEETGENLWMFSELHVVTTAGEAQLWRTRLKHNTSKLRTPYIQFPTLRVKDRRKA